MAAIEPISSMMTIQVQPVQPVASQSSSSNSMTVKPAEDFVSGGQEVPQIDPKTLVVKNASETDEENASSYGQSPNAQSTASETEESIQRQNEKVRKAVEDLNKNMENSVAQFGIHEKTNRVTIKIVDKDSKKVIKELPPEKTLDMIAKVWELAGLIVDERR